MARLSTDISGEIQSVDLSDAQHQYNVGVSYENGDGVDKNMTEAVRYYRLAADQGYADAQYKLGVCYFSGDGVKKDLTV